MTDKLKLLPREATREMLEAMDECSMEGYDERLYAGHAGSVYMAAWDAFHGQHCYCGDITKLGVIHRNDGPCHYPEHTSEYKRGYADAMNWKVQNHLEHLQPKVRTGDCLLTGVCASEGHKIQPKEPEHEPDEVDIRSRLYQRIHELETQLAQPEQEPCKTCGGTGEVETGIGMMVCDECHGTTYTTPPQRTWVGLTVEEMKLIDPDGFEDGLPQMIEAKLKEKNT